MKKMQKDGYVIYTTRYEIEDPFFKRFVQLIGSSLFLEYIGQNSLLYCLFHISFSLLVLKIVNVTPLIEHASPIAYVFLFFWIIYFSRIVYFCFLCID